MAYCPYCGKYWLVRSGTKVKRAIMGFSHNDVVDPPDMTCPDCEGTRGAANVH
jgi:hypothetical protein